MLERLNLAENALKEAKSHLNKRYRLGYHIMAPANWINDPNGMIQFNGEYHVFYQHHPFDENWGPMHWGHVKSKDLVHWEHCKVALAPGDKFDKDGCFSGSAVNNNGEFVLIYTGHNYIDKKADTFYQTQNIAISTDGLNFEKFENNPVIAEPPSDSIHHFRDPKVWKHEDKWYMVLGNSTKDNIGRVILYNSDDLKEWNYIGVLAQSNGDLGYMWECPDFFKLNDKYVLTFSPQGMKRQGDLYCNLYQTGYIVGNYDYEKNEFIHGSFRELDNGHDFYALQTLLDDKGRRIAIGWMDMWESDMPSKKDGWCGALTLPRVLTLGENNKILMNPVEELKLLREQQKDLCLNKVISENIKYSLNKSDYLMEIKLLIDLKDSSSKYCGLNILGNNMDKTSLIYDSDNNKLTLDCSKCGKKEDGQRSVTLDNNDNLSLHIFLDRSSIEVFINEGEATMTSRIYPSEEIKKLELISSLGNTKIKELTYWNLKNVFE